MKLVCTYIGGVGSASLEFIIILETDSMYFEVETCVETSEKMIRDVKRFKTLKTAHSYYKKAEEALERLRKIR